ncbi:ankyrin [Stipitochalara longipes BDJ]|nr:ankyrin [Stipitochalara longipes BDJ]
MFEMLVKAGASLNARQNDGITPLMLAAEYDQLDVIKDLIALVPLGLDLHATDIDGSTALHHAVEFGPVDNAKLLIEAGLSPTKLDIFERSSIALALYDKIEPYPLELLPGIDNLRSRIRGSHLNIATFMGNEPIVMELLKRVPEHGIYEYVNLPCKLGTPLYNAASRGHIPIMEKLIEKGAEIDLVGGPFGSPLMAACTSGQTEAVAWLLRKGAEFQCTKLDGTAITAEEAAQQHENVISLLKRFKEKGAGALDEETPVKTADISKLDEFMVGFKERKEKSSKEANTKDNEEDKGNKSEVKDEVESRFDSSDSSESES